MLEHGIGGVSLRPMANALGVTHATLIRHFGSKELLLSEICEHVRAGLLQQMEADEELRATSSVAELLHTLWRRFFDPREQRQFLLLAEVYGRGVRDRSRFDDMLVSAVRDFVSPLEERLVAEGCPPDRARVLATALLAQIRGLQLDFIATGDRERVDEAFALTLDAMLPR